MISQTATTMTEALHQFYLAETKNLNIHALEQQDLLHLWRQTMKMGLSQALVSETEGGIGLNALETTLLIEEAGRWLLPLPISQAIVVTKAFTDQNVVIPTSIKNWLAGDRLCAISQNRKNPHFLFTEYSLFTENAVILDWQQEPFSIDFSTLIANQKTGIDPSMAAYAKTDKSLLVDPIKIFNGEDFYHLSLLLRIAELIGATTKAHDMAVNYAKERTQFGKAIGSNQAIKHRLADQWMALDHCRLALHDAASQWPPSPEQSNSFTFALYAALVLSIEASKDICAFAIQVHGALGFTWEYPAHYYLKRAQHHCLFLEHLHPVPTLLQSIWNLKANAF